MKDYKRIKPSIIEQLETSFFDTRMENLSPKEIKLLVFIAGISTEDIRFGNIIARSGMTKQALSRYLGVLAKKGILYNQKRGVYRFLFQCYVIICFVTMKNRLLFSTTNPGSHHAA